MINITTIYDEDENEIELPTKWVICSNCSGDGHHSRHLGAMSQDDLDQQDPDFLEDWQAGVYDRKCEECDGTGKIKVVDFDRLTPDQREAHKREYEAEAAIRAEEAAEQRYFYGSAF